MFVKMCSAVPNVSIRLDNCSNMIVFAFIFVFLLWFAVISNIQVFHLLVHRFL